MKKTTGWLLAIVAIAAGLRLLLIGTRSIQYDDAFSLLLADRSLAEIVQGTAADLIKIAMIRMDQALSERNMESAMLLTVHDELVFEVADDKIDEAAAKIRAIMENVVTLDVPLIAEAGSAKNWAEAH